MARKTFTQNRLMKRKDYRLWETRRNYWYNKAQDILQWDSCYIKEKWWRVDTSYFWDRPGVQDRLLDEVEWPSEVHCQICNSGATQHWTEDHWWVVHYCLRCLIIDKTYLFLMKIKRWILGSLKSLRDLITHHTD